MKTRLHTSDLQELIAEAQYPNGFLDQGSNIVERTYVNEAFLGKGGYTEMFFDGLHIGYGDLALYQDTQLYFETDMETVEMHFLMCGDTWTKDQETGNVFEFGCNQHNIFYSDGFRGISEWSHKAKMQIFEVNLLPSLFEKYLPNDANLFEAFRSNIFHRKQAQLSHHNLSVTPQMLLIIREILQTQRQGAFKKMFMEAKVIELLMLQLEQISSHCCDTFCNLKKSDVEKVYAVK
ncbi:MAG: AraC family transcriptional regulator, partial [Bacteroidota bacterium]